MNNPASVEVRKNHLISRFVFKVFLALLIFFFGRTFNHVCNKKTNFIVNDGHSYVSKDGFISDEKMATKIAELIAKKIYGDAEIDGQKPFQTNLKGEVWIVSGTISPNSLGGTFEVYISKVDGKIIRVTHGK